MHSVPEGAPSRSGGLAILPSQSNALNELLTELADRLPARFALLTEVSGRALSSAGDKSQANGSGAELDIVALAALVAGDLAASQAIARITGEYQDYQVILRQGQENHILITGVGDSLALLVQVGNAVPLGWARLLIVDVARRMADVAASTEDDEEAMVEALKQSDWADVLNDALNSLWTEEGHVR